ncbi:MAG: recombinase family protein [Pseudonocardiaceae bacterium]
MLIGYARVSTAEQNPAHQVDALRRVGVEAEGIHVDVASGAKSSRPKLDLAMKLLRDGDTLVVTRLDRLGRSVVHLVVLGADLRDRGVGLRVLEQGIDTATAEGRAMFGMLSVLAELQRELIVANTRDGLAAARARGRHGGRRSKLTVDQVRTAQRLYDEGEHTVAQIAAMFGVKRSTLYGHLDQTTVGGRPRAAKTERRFAPDVEMPNGRGDDPAAALTALPRPIRAQITRPDQELSPRQKERGDRLPRQRRRRSGPAISPLACPSCGHEPASRSEALHQREDLAVVWLHQVTRADPITQHQYCAHCQPHGHSAILACARCGDGPILTGARPRTLGAGLATVLRGWLAYRGWRVTPELLCPHDQT